ncbi:xanthine dehydrogenase family protein molybdopterin-binding subunit [Paracoccus suum]|uniref:Xanthine dehydrogenase family protein molybdopterin-binding subunit n=1 Tax=Paracoccus suum TaxID=2259340 RepID=A0A344PMT3_9RHOB|nr:aldehyde oxidoreductase molybdenum-binding subunit PaoC [Paracoccus suum]AXC50688.1 xanthine dehydrogenase family protein molybdopterin-binding subunit [Paracoccus suum]
MEFLQPATANPTDRQQVLGHAHPRIEGALKTTGTAHYAYERQDVTGLQLVGYPLGAGIAKGRILSMDTAAAEAAPGVHAVITTLQMDPLPKHKNNIADLFGGSRIHHYHQAIAVVVAESFEQARAAAQMIEVEYRASHLTDFDLAAAHDKNPDKAGKTLSRVGDFDKAFAEAEVTLDAHYRTPAQSHCMMEPHASIAEWRDGKLTVWTSTQMVAWTQKALARTFQLAAEDVRVDSAYIGGGFGGKLWLRADAVLAALGARQTGRPVRVALPRPLMMNNTTHRAETYQRIRIGAGRDGRIAAIAHDGLSSNIPGGHGENPVDQTRHFYAGANRLMTLRMVNLDLPEPNSMRAPGEGAGMMALEVAMDEMAEKLGMDPVEFRAINDTQVDPENPERAFSDRHFVRCLREGASAFAWADRNIVPGARREGMWLIGQGMSGGYRKAAVMKSGARVTLRADARVLVEADMTDIGTGSYTIMAQTAAEMLGLPLDAIEVRLGGSDMPVSSGSGGQWGAASATAGVYAACLCLREEIARRMGNSDPAALTLSDGQVTSGDKTVPLAQIASAGEITSEESMGFGALQKEYLIATFAAHFAEVAVHVATGEIRVRRTLSVCDAGRIMNPMTARSQVIGGMVMGIGAALSEQIEVDTGRGFFANHDLAGYEVPVHADIPDQQVIFLDTEDPAASPLKAKGVGELGISGAAAAIANAAYNATGIRLRSYPLTLDKMLNRLPAV